MTREYLLQFLKKKILTARSDTPFFVGIDGVDGSGKSIFADELAEHLRNKHQKVVRASLDGFHNPEHVRYQKGKDSPEGYYADSFNYREVSEVLLKPLRSGVGEYRTSTFDYRTNSKTNSPIQQSTPDTILVMDGVFLFRPELLKYWDMRIFLDVDFEETLRRVLQRSTEQEYIGAEQKILERYRNRYIPGQKLYLKNVNVRGIADVLIDNTDVQNPIIKKGKTCFFSEIA
ncbi:hypothetical protein IPN35_05210 [Candidatus Peregrinibacteria bacterium]|nr:MAG: hypothetical protein IPN35_05210 [Candidatus Peregrinibacteria bacterium]